MNPTRFTSSTEVEEAFYSAFGSGDLEAMRGIWLQDEQTSCIHPMGDRLLGTHAIMKSWETILRNTGDVIIELSDRVIHSAGQVAIHTLVENIHSPQQSDQLFRFVVTNIYESGAEGWKMVLHHASPMPRDTSQDNQPHAVVH